jgi:hypothetical protein
MSRRPPNLARILVVGFTLALVPFKAGGCDGGRTACFTVTGQTCPSQDALNSSIASSPANLACSGEISSVDGPGTLDGDLCCYPVTYVSGNGVPCDLVITTSEGTGGFTTGFSSSTGTFGGSSSGTFGSSSGLPPNCVSCNAALQGAPFDQACDPTPLANLRVCACANKCTEACDPTLCTSTGNAPDNVCRSCLQANCASELMACQES